MSIRPVERARVFIGSSTEGLKVAKAIQVGLDSSAEVTLWSQGVFGLSMGTLEELVRASKQFEFAILVLTPDDLVDKRGTTGNSPRDNVVFELGFFMGALGRERTFIVYCRDDSLQLPSDLAGVTAATFGRRSDGNLRAAVGPCCTQIEDAITHALASGQPEVKVTVRRIGGDQVMLIMDAQNDVPFECQYLYKLESNVVISGIQLDWSTVVPTPQNRRFNSKNKVRLPASENVVLSFKYRGLVDPSRPRNQQLQEIEQVYSTIGQELVLIRDQTLVRP